MGTTKGQKVVRIPISTQRRWRNRLGSGYVPCIITDRWLQFPKQSGAYLSDGEVMTVDVMTGTPDEPRKLCDLTITREDLIRAIESVGPPPEKKG